MPGGTTSVIRAGVPLRVRSATADGATARDDEAQLGDVEISVSCGDRSSGRVAHVLIIPVCVVVR